MNQFCLFHRTLWSVELTNELNVGLIMNMYIVMWEYATK